MTPKTHPARRPRTSLTTHAKRTFASLSVRNYRLYLVGQTISLCGTWMQMIAQSLLVLEMTGSGAALGLVSGLQWAPMLFLAPYGGVLAERYSKRRILFVTQSVSGVLALLLGLLVLTGSVRLWMVYVLALAFGLVNAADNPARQTFVHEMVGPKHLGNAVSLNSIMLNLTRIIGPMLGGVVVATLGLAACFLINSLSFVAVLACLALMRGSELMLSERVKAAPGQLREGFAYVLATPVLRDVLLMMAIAGMLSWEFSVTLPLLSRVTFAGTQVQVAGWMALLMAMMGVGAVIGGLLNASVRFTMRTLTVGAFGFGVAIALVALAPTLLWAYAAMTVVGYFSVTFTAQTNTILQASSSATMRGRVMALWAVAFMGSAVIGGPAIGWVAELAGPRWALGVGALASCVAGLVGVASVRAGHERAPATEHLMIERERSA